MSGAAGVGPKIQETRHADTKLDINYNHRIQTIPQNHFKTYFIINSSVVFFYFMLVFFYVLRQYCLCAQSSNFNLPTKMEKN